MQRRNYSGDTSASIGQTRKLSRFLRKISKPFTAVGELETFHVTDKLWFHV